MGAFREMTSASTYVDLETAKSASGVRIATVGGVPSPWSESAKALFRLHGVPFVAVRMMPGDKTVKEWTRTRNAPAVMYENEPARAGWAEILELAERLAPPSAKSLVPTEPNDRVRMFGLAHEVLGEGGLLWSGRLATIDASFETNGARGFPSMVAGYLSKKYGYAKERMPAALRRVEEVWSLLTDTLGSREYFFFDDRPSALDVYVATALNLFDVPTEEQCPGLFPPMRVGFESMRGSAVTPPPASLLALRERMYTRHLGYPIEV
jgi:glutathione S-transferase